MGGPMYGSGRWRGRDRSTICRKSRGGRFCMARPKSTPIEPVTPTTKKPAGTGSAAAGQAGDIQGLPGREDVENESVRELQEEGQSYEASVVDGVENAPLPDEGAVR